MPLRTRLAPFAPFILAAPLALGSSLGAGCHSSSSSPGSDSGVDAKPKSKDAAEAATPDAGSPGFTVYVASANEPPVQSFFEFLPEAHASVHAVNDPASSAAADPSRAVHVAVLTDLTCGECYQLTASGTAYEVHGGNTLGAQYGLAQLLEEFDFRFFHPWQSKTPTSLLAPTSSKNIGPQFTPAMTLRGLHLHTLHPIESYFAFWGGDTGAGDAGADASVARGIDGARRVIDWIIKNRGNYVEWSALNNIVSANATDFASWHARTSAVLAYAHARGIKVGIGAELFGVANFQNAFDLLDTETESDPKGTVDQRLHLLFDGLPWDIFDLSFGEFNDTDATTFLTNVNLTYTELQALAPGTEMAATVHVGSSPSLEVTYDGMQIFYYFLVKYADPHIVPWIHTVMYFDLFQSADGAYGMPNFDQHLAYLQSRLAANQPVAYYPEAAYWIAFDSSVPTYLPVYMRSRWLDMTRIGAAAAEAGYAGLSQHVQFSSGWEWGYWQTDYASLRMNFTTPTAWTDPVDDMFAPWGASGASLATQIGALGELQSKYLIDQSLAAYVASQDELIAIGAGSGIVSQPLRTTFAELASMSAADQATFASTVLTPLAALDAHTQAIADAVAALQLDPRDPWLAETMDGIAIDADRVHYISSLYQAVASFVSTGTDGGWLAKAETTLADAMTIVARRDAALHYPNPPQILGAGANFTEYQSGYLTEAATLCLWNRERLQARAILVNDTSPLPLCVP